jgi:hypothetical protein
MMRAALEEVVRRSAGSDELLLLLQNPFSSNVRPRGIST